MLQESISSAQLAEWMAYARIEPFGSEIEDYRFGQVCSSTANFAGKAIPPDSPPMTPADFFNWAPEEEEEEGEPEEDEVPEDLKRLSAEVLALFDKGNE